MKGALLPCFISCRAILFALFNDDLIREHPRGVSGADMPFWADTDVPGMHSDITGADNPEGGGEILDERPSSRHGEIVFK